jgi:hypothetical protein
MLDRTCVRVRCSTTLPRWCIRVKIARIGPLRVPQASEVTRPISAGSHSPSFRCQLYGGCQQGEVAGCQHHTPCEAQAVGKSRKLVRVGNQWGGGAKLHRSLNSAMASGSTTPWVRSSQQTSAETNILMSIELSAARWLVAPARRERVCVWAHCVCVSPLAGR